MNTTIVKKGLVFKKAGIWIILGIFVVIVTGNAIINGKWLYLGVMIVVPILIYFSIEKPFIFPFGAYVFLLPFDQLLSLTNTAGGATLTKFFGILTILVLLIKGSFEKKLRRPDSAVAWWILFVLYGTLSMLWAIQPELVLARIPTAAGLLLLYLLAASYKIQKNEFDTLKWCIVGGGVISAILIIYNFRSLETVDRVTVQFGERSAGLNELPFDLLISVSICIEKLFNVKRKMMKVLFILLLSIIIFSIIITGSRGGLVGVGVIFVVYILSMRRRLSAGLVLLVIGIILLSLTPGYFIERLREAQETGGAGRTFIWTNALNAFKHYWTIGAGLNNFPEAYAEFGHFTPFSEIYRGSHNIYLGTFVELGIIGFSLMVLGIRKHYQAIKSRFAYYNNNQVMLKASFWAMLVASFFLDTFWYKSFWLLWMMIMMHQNVVKRENKLFELSRLAEK
jgi:O-antigen ligase